MVVCEQEQDLIRGTPEVIDHSHPAALATFSPRDSPTEFSASRRTNDDVTGGRADQQVFLHPLIILTLKECGDEFRKHRRLDEGDILIQREVDIGPDETLGDVYFKKIFPAGVDSVLAIASSPSR